MKKLLIFLFFAILVISACTTKQTPIPTLTLVPTDLPTASPTNTATAMPTLTLMHFPTSTPTPVPIEFPYSTLPGRFAYMDFDCDGLCTNVSIIKPDMTEQKRLTDHDYGMVASILWSPNGRYIAYQFIVLGENGGLQLRLFDIKTKRMSILTSKYIGNVSGLSWSPDNRFLVIGYQNEDGKNGRIQRIDIQNHQISNLTKDLAFQDVMPAWSPDGKKIVFSAKSTDGTNSIWQMDANGSNLKDLLPENNERSVMPSWSPDGSKITFYQQDAENITQLWIMDADGSNSNLLHVFGKASVIETPVWSPDGTKIGVTYGDEEQTDIMLLEPRAGHNVSLIEKEGKYTGLSWSPDSKALIYMRHGKEIGDRTIYLFIFNSENPFTVSVDTPMEMVVWSPVEEVPTIK